MATTLTVNGVAFSYPDTGDQNWGTAASGWAAAVTTGMLQKAGGTFTLTADVNFGNSFGLFAKYFTSVTANPAGTGILRLANADGIGFRNSGNSADFLLKPDADGFLQYNNIDLANISSAQTLTNKTMSGSSNTFSSIAYSSLILTGDIVNADISASAAIAYSKLNLASSIVNADISTSAAIAFSKLATLSSANILVGSAANVATSVAVSGDISLSNAGVTAYSGTVPLNKGGTGTAAASANAAFNALSPLTTKGDVLGFSTINARVAVGADGTVLTADSAQTAGLKWTSVLTNPMTTLGDIIYENASPAAARLAGNTTSTKNFLTQTGTGSVSAAPAWGTIANTDLSAITNSQLSGSAAISNANLASMATLTIKGNNTGGSSTPLDLTQAQSRSLLTKTPTLTFLTSTGTTTGWLFTISTSTTCAASDTYTNNGHTYTVLYALSAASGQVLFMSGASAPTASGTLARSAGAGTSSVTFSAATALATYTPAAGILRLRVKMVGGGGGGSGSGTSVSTSGNTAGGPTFLGDNFAAGGGAPTSGIQGGGGGGSGGLGTTATWSVSVVGTPGGGASDQSSTVHGPSGTGGSSFLGGGGPGTYAANAGVAGQGYGGGGSGGGLGSFAGTTGAGGGGGGGLDLCIGTVAATYPYCIGAAGAGASAGTNGQAGAAGFAGAIFIEEIYI